MNISKLKKGIVTLCSALVIATGSFSQPNPNVYRNDELNSMIRLEALMNASELSIRFVAPAAEETEAIVSAQESLNNLADATEASIKYKAPAIADDNKVAPELERLDKLADLTENNIRYEAPAAEVAPAPAAAMPAPAPAK